MKRHLGIALAAGAMLAASGLATSAMAKTTDIGQLTDGSFNSFANQVKGNFTDTYLFSLSGPYQFDTAISASATTNAGIYINGFTLTLQELTAPGVYTTVAYDTKTHASSRTNDPNTTGTGVGVDQLLDTGSYRFLISGDAQKGILLTSPAATASYGGTYSVNAVPLPNSVAMFGLALGGLGVAGALRRKAGKGVTSAA